MRETAEDTAPRDVTGGGTQTATFAVDGMTCASCVRVVEKTVERLPGTAGPSVNLATERLTVDFDPSVVSEDDIVAAVKAAGYGAMPLAEATGSSEGKVTLDVAGMTCASCQAVVERTLGRLDGVSSAVVNLANETATVTFDPAVIAVDALISAVNGVGYKASVHADVAPGETTDAQREAINAPIQGTAADIMKIAMLRVDAALRDAGFRGRMLLQVHDELVLECPPEETEALVQVVRQVMEQAYTLDAPLETEARIGTNWGSLTPLESG